MDDKFKKIIQRELKKLVESTQYPGNKRIIVTALKKRWGYDK